MSTKAVMEITARPEQIFIKGKGSWLWDQNGNKVLDFIQGWAVNTLGHSPEIISRMLTEQSQKLLNPSPAFFNEPMIKCANTLVNNSVFDQVFFANSGAEANEGAIKLARKWGQINKAGAYNIITFENSFHGRTLTTMAASGKTAFAPLFEPKTSGFIKVPFNDIEAVKAVIDEQTVAIMLEPILGEAGIIPANQEFISYLGVLADQYNLLLIFDEVQTGIGRTGNLFAYQGYGIEPDIMTLAKGLGGGVPISALLAKEHCCVFEYGDQGGTFNGNPLMTSVADAILNEVIKDEFMENVHQSSEYLVEGLQKLSEQFNLGEVRGKGLLIALDTRTINANKIVEFALSRELLLNAPNTHTLRLMPALNVSTDEINQMFVILVDTLNAVIKCK